ncbi:polysaccharide biosynthesis C-terminal domain-containing protein [Halomarina ordinaria]|uniref:Polysaccharide biosynthesis C-terminal domain-containing protein n=1 Tax=Halomarina ordinaria TaxID=3033939 RepID=A0ABD5U724_9EURY|nr:polysaccharide biosynthesis C-terminal domain-containing protein [Halomarina sp. PSRA2]
MATSLARGFVSILGARVATIGLHIAITPLLVRYLGAEYGDYAFLLSLSAVTLVFVDSLFDGVRKFVSEDREAVEWEATVFGFYVRVTVLASVAVVLAVVLAVESGLVVSVLSARFVPYLYLLGGIVVVQQFFTVGRSTLMGLGYEHLSEPLTSVEKFLFGVLAVVFLEWGWGVVGVLLSQTITYSLVLVAALWFISRELPLRSALTLAPTSFPRREVLSFNTVTAVYLLLANTLIHVDVLLLRPTVGSLETGYYKAALLVAEFLWIVPIAMENLLVHSSSGMSSRGEHRRIERLTARMTRYVTLLTSLMILVVGASAHVLVPLYFGAAYAPAVGPALLLLPGALGFAIARPLIGVVQGTGHLRVLVGATAVAAVLNLALNLALIPRYGMYGAAVATSVSYGSMLGLHVWSSRKSGVDPAADFRFPRVATTVFATALAVFGVVTAGPPTLPTVLTAGLVGTVVHAIVAVKTRAVDGEDIALFLSLLPPPVREVISSR